MQFGCYMCLEGISNIVKGIRKHYPVSDASIKQLASFLEEKHVPKNHVLTQAGKRDHHIYFIEKGCARTYFLLNGKEVTNWLSKEGDVTFSSNSLYYGKAGLDYVELLEDAIIYAMPITVLNQLYATDIDIANWSRTIHQAVLLQMQQLRIDRLSLSSKARYEKFLQEHPGLINRINLGYVASYLGMTQQHLSSIRAEF